MIFVNYIIKIMTLNANDANDKIMFVWILNIGNKILILERLLPTLMYHELSFCQISFSPIFINVSGKFVPSISPFGQGQLYRLLNASSNVDNPQKPVNGITNFWLFSDSLKRLLLCSQYLKLYCYITASALNLEPVVVKLWTIALSL